MEYKRYGDNGDLYRANAAENEPKLKVIMEGDYRERHFVIGAHRGGYPNAYLEVKPTDTMIQEAKKYEDYEGNINRVYQGSSYFGKAYWDNSDSRTYVGWSYSGASSYCARHPEFEGKKWRLIDILMEIACAEDEIDTMNENDPDYLNRLLE